MKSAVYRPIQTKPFVRLRQKPLGARRPVAAKHGLDLVALMMATQRQLHEVSGLSGQHDILSHTCDEEEYMRTRIQASSYLKRRF
ncbi:MAG: hypothetical protein OXT67_09055 [Zetaproteobacteria bacterium]|nr:hypothetical protein [Zetaproteobacteria bacterium]